MYRQIGTILVLNFLHLSLKHSLTVHLIAAMMRLDMVGLERKQTLKTKVYEETI